MRRLAILLILSSLILPGEVLALNDNEEAAANEPPAEFLVYAVTWQPTFCVMKPETPGCDRPPQRFLTHGIWPYSPSTDTYTNRHPQFCTSSPGCQGAKEACDIGADDMQTVLSNPTLRALVTKEPEGMFRHEWKKHGTCSGKTKQAYFQDLVTLRPVVMFKHDRFESMIGEASEFSEIRKAFPTNTAFRCYRNSDGEQYLHEVFYLIKGDGQPYLPARPVEIGVQCLEQKTLIPGGK